MKKISIFMMVVGLISLVACKKVDKTTLDAVPQTATLNLADGAVIVLKEEDKNDTVIYNWTAAAYGPDLVITYTLQVDIEDSNFANPVAIGTIIHETELSILVGELNNKLLPLLANPAVPQTLKLAFRVMSAVNTNVPAAYSTAVKQTITPYYVPIVYPILNVPGSYQGWDPADSTNAIGAADPKKPDKFEGYIMFTDNTEFKYAKGSWDLNWGDNGGDGTLEPGGANILCPVGGYYKLNVDLAALTHAFVKTMWGVIGSATPGGWDNDTDLIWDEASKTWSVTMDLTAGDIKFRANDDWTLNYGDNAGNGTLQENGANIPITAAGNYTITLDLSKPIYTYKVTQN